jgi:colanic acid biosynthesis glycosyl transferase WcaI
MSSLAWLLGDIGSYFDGRRMRRLLIITQWYPPEHAPFGHMMRELAAGLVRGHWEVTVVTGFPNHPAGEVFSGFKKRWVQEETENGVRVIRVWLATSKTRSLASRMLTFASFSFTAAWRALRIGKVDIIFAVLQPLSMGVVLPLIARLKGASLVFNVQDLHPQTQIKLGILKNRAFIWALRHVERYSYRAALHLTVICETFKRHCLSEGVGAGKISVIGNWIDTDRIRPSYKNNLFRQKVTRSEADFVVLWAGTLGYVSGADIVVACAKLLAGLPGVRFVVVGEGPARAQLISTSRAFGLQNIEFIPFQAEEDLQFVQASADVSLVTVDFRFADSSVPSKVMAYMAAGRAIVAAVPDDSETAMLLRRADCARIVASSDPFEMAAAIRLLYADPQVVVGLGHKARVFAESELSMTAGVAKYAP